MTRKSYEEMLLPPGNVDLLWELFHENSKVSRYAELPSDNQVRERMAHCDESLHYRGYPIIELPDNVPPLNIPLSEAIFQRASPRGMIPYKLSLEQIGMLLHYSYGISRDNKVSSLPRSFRVAPSGGALYPLEIYFYSPHVEGIHAGLYHYNPVKNHLRVLRKANELDRIADGLIQRDFVSSASMIVFITAIFDRSIFKYGDRGYRFILLEAGHVAQNLNLVAIALGLVSLNIGGFFDRSIDEYLGIDGLTHSTVYLALIGKPAKSQPVG